MPQPPVPSNFFEWLIVGKANDATEVRDWYQEFVDMVNEFDADAKLNRIKKVYDNDLSPVVLGTFDSNAIIHRSVASTQTYTLPEITADLVGYNVFIAASGASSTIALTASGSDEIFVLGASVGSSENVTERAAFLAATGLGHWELSFLVREGEDPTLHAGTHERSGTDEIVVTDLTGLLNDPQKVTVRKNTGADVGSQPRLNIIEGTNVSIDIAEDVGDNEIDITVNAIGSGSGDVNGPVSAVDNELSIYNGTTGKIIKGGTGVTVDGSGNFAGVGTINGTDLDSHSTRHEDGGADEISVDALSGELADAQKTTIRKNSGADVGTRSRLNFVEGSNISLTVTDDAGDGEVDITVASTNPGGDVVGPVSSVDSELSLFDSTTGKLIKGGTGVTVDGTGNMSGVGTVNGVTVGDHSGRHENGGADEISIADLSGESADPQKTTIRKNSGADVGSRSRINLIEGTNITMTVADDAGDGEVDVTVNTSGEPNVWETPAGTTGTVQVKGNNITVAAGVNYGRFDGQDHNITGGDGQAVSGFTHTVSSTSTSVTGEQNTDEGGESNTVNGNGNVFDGCAFSGSIGRQNNLTNNESSLAVGNGHTGTNANYFLSTGLDHTIDKHNVFIRGEGAYSTWAHADVKSVDSNAVHWRANKSNVLLFASTSNTTKTDVMTLDADGTETFSSDPYNDDPAFIPIKFLIVAKDIDGGEHKMWEGSVIVTFGVVPIESKNIQKIAGTSGSENWTLDITADSSQIYFNVDQVSDTVNFDVKWFGEATIYSMNNVGV
ncbi:MAG: hypothetical protein KAS32_22140 [Candidatus Peribacteraceae bacterium]|nr:hypothetical protein [Candidatus Peribacteraceae bacterium]